MAVATLELRSPAFKAGGRIPRKHCFRGVGENVSPPLAWDHGPEGTVEYVLICDDPDAPTDEPFSHWVLYGIPAEITELKEGLPSGKTTLMAELLNARQGMNGYGEAGWGGPMPPRRSGPHHYHFRLWALPRQLELPEGATRELVLRAIDEDTVLAQGELIGTFER